MPVPTFALRASFTGNGVASTFPFSFRFLDDVDLRVSTKDPFAGNVIPLTLYDDYTVQGAGLYSGGSITLLTGALPDGMFLYVERIVEPLQTALIEGSASLFSDVVARLADRFAMGLQQLDDVLGVYDPNRVRVPKLPPTDADGSGRYDARGNRLGNLTDPDLPQDAATKVWTMALVNAVAANIIAIVGTGGGTGGLAILEYTLATRPAADATTKNQLIVIKDSGQPAYAQLCLELAAGAVFEWVTIASAPPA